MYILVVSEQFHKPYWVDNRRRGECGLDVTWTLGSFLMKFELVIESDFVQNPLLHGTTKVGSKIFPMNRENANGSRGVTRLRNMIRAVM